MISFRCHTDKFLIFHLSAFGTLEESEEVAQETLPYGFSNVQGEGGELEIETDARSR